MPRITKRKAFKKVPIFKENSQNNKVLFLSEPKQMDWENKCAASVLSKKTLMTAAHCLRDHNSLKSAYKIIVGQTILNSENYDANRQQLNISKVMYI